MENETEHETPPTVEHETPVQDNHGAIEKLVHELTEKVNALEETVGTLVVKGDPDTTPVKKPWTHWGSQR